MHYVFMRAGQVLTLVVHARVWIEHLIGKLRADFIFWRRRAQARVLAGPSAGESVFPAVGDLAGRFPLFVNDLRAGFYRSRKTAFGRLVERLPH